MKSDEKSDLNLLYLRLELARIDVLLRREVRRWQLAGQDIHDAYRGLYVSDSDANQLLSRPLATSWGQTSTLETTENLTFQNDLENAEKQLGDFLKQYQDALSSLRLLQLLSVFQLDKIDRDIFLICFAPCIDLKYEKIFGYLQDDVTRKQPGVNLILNLLAPPGVDRFSLWPHLIEDGPLFKYQIIQRISDNGKIPLLKQILSIDETIIGWLLGNYQPQQDLPPYIHLVSPTISQIDRLMVNEILLAQLTEEKKRHFVFHGPDLGAQESTARIITDKLHTPLLIINMSGIVRQDTSAHRALLAGLRDGLLTGGIPFITGWDSVLTEDRTAPADLLTEICSYPGTLIISGISEWHAMGVDRDSSFTWQDFPLPEYSKRCVLWKQYLATYPAETGLDIEPLAAQFELSSSQIRDACLSARDEAEKKSRNITLQDLFMAARAHSNPRLSSLARKITPRYGWEDIVLPDDQLCILKEIINTVKGRPKVLLEWGVGKKLAASSGVPILFSGPPGTGKTMAAEIIAGELGLDLYKIDLSSIVSKYIGETEKNMERIFSEAESSNAILFFDEADALFGKRSEVRDSHDRYANIEISYLLQRMEAYDGVTILATNIRSNLDDAFTRRLQFAVSFPFPDEPDRLRIWKALFPPDLPRGSDIDLPLLARRFKLPGGNIRNIIVNAAFLASADGGQVTMGHLFHSIHREYQKLGRLVGEDDLTLG